MASDAFSNSFPSGDALLSETAKLAVDVVDESRIALMTALRFMDIALWRMPLASKPLGRAMGTDGYLVYLDTVAVVSAYLKGPAEVTRDYLHAVLHCVFRHPFDERHPHRALWDLACDIAVESCALELVGARYPSALDGRRRRVLEKLKGACGRITADKVYNALVEALDEGGGEESVPGLGAANPGEGRGPGGASGPGEGRGSGVTAARKHAPSHRANVLEPRFVASLPELFVRDDHTVWTREQERPIAQITFSNDVELIGVNDERLRGKRSEELDLDDADTKPAVNMAGSPAPSTGGAAAEGEVEGADRLLDIDALEEGEATFADMLGVPSADFDDVTWTDISQLLEIEMEAFIGKAGTESGTFEVNLGVANRKSYDYREFLRRFSALSEEMKVSTEEFDYIYYTYGLARYGNMPLIEPLEYQESRRVREFVIAIDTSSSCAGGLVRHFVEKTYDVLKSTAAFGRKVNVHIVQCDSEVRKVVKITETSQLDDEFGEFTARGFGGTDFRPVFKYVDEQIAAREFTNLKGMIYLTDGIGTYPEEPPDYECAFVFIDESCDTRKVPPWAMKVLMTEDEVLEL